MKALRLWLQDQYGPIFGPAPFALEAAQDFMQAMKDGTVPEWVFDVAPIAEIKAVSKGGG